MEIKEEIRYRLSINRDSQASPYLDTFHKVVFIEELRLHNYFTNHTYSMYYILFWLMWEIVHIV